MTNKEKSGQDKLMEAMRMSEVSCWEKFPRVEGEIHYSEDYLRDMEKLIKKSRNPIRKYFDTVGKRVAAAVIAAVALSGSMMSVSAVREPVVEFITNVYEKFVEIIFDEEDIVKAPSTIEIVYTLGKIPEDYVFDNITIGKLTTCFTWCNKNGDKIFFSQNILDNSDLLDNESSEYELLFHDNMKIAYTNKNGIRSFIWNTAEYTYMLYVPDDIYMDECYEIIESVQKFNQ